MSSYRIYLVTTHKGERRLVRASHRSQAINHVARTMMEASVARQEELVELVTQGVKVEAVRDPDQDELFAGEKAHEAVAE
jgi:hypothetical protein